MRPNVWLPFSIAAMITQRIEIVILMMCFFNRHHQAGTFFKECNLSRLDQMWNDTFRQMRTHSAAAIHLCGKETAV